MFYCREKKGNREHFKNHDQSRAMKMTDPHYIFMYDPFFITIYTCHYIWSCLLTNCGITHILGILLMKSYDF